MLDRRSGAILWCILNATSYIPIEEIGDKLNISKRTIYYDIKKINSWLKVNKMPGICQMQSIGLYLEEGVKQAVTNLLQHLSPWHYDYCAKERKAWLAIHIMARSRTISLQDLIKAIRVSRNTTINDLNILRAEISRRFELHILVSKQTGYVMMGREVDQRKALNVYMSQVIVDKGWQYFIDEMAMVDKMDDGNVTLFSTNNVSELQQILVNCEEHLGVQFTDEVLHHFSLQMILFVRRLMLGGRVVIEPSEQGELRQTREYEVAQKICDKLTKLYQIDIPQHEVDYVTTYILSAKVNYMALDILNDDDPHWQVIIKRMVDDFQSYACVQFYDRTGLENNLLIHLKPAYYRIKYGLYLENSLLDSIRNKYPDIFSLTKKVIHYLEESVGQRVDDEEVAFVAMHFGAWMKREGIRPIVRKKVLLVCANGVGTSLILQSQLEEMLSMVDILATVSMRDYIQHEKEVDFVISTMPLRGGCKPVFVVSPILSHGEIESLLKKVNTLFPLSQGKNVSVHTLMEIISRHTDIREQDKLIKELRECLYKPTSIIQEDHRPMLTDLITKDMIQLLDEATDWEQAIRLAAVPLLQEGFIKEEYIKAMIDTIKEFGPYVVMGPKVAIPHARPENGVNRVGMSLLRLKKGVAFSETGEKQVQIIIILAAVDNETHLQALAQLSMLLMEEENIERLANSTSKAEILDIIEKYSH